jgi:hypothetical protein
MELYHGRLQGHLDRADHRVGGWFGRIGQGSLASKARKGNSHALGCLLIAYAEALD